jgi:hypothetical protein
MDSGMLNKVPGDGGNIEAVGPTGCISSPYIGGPRRLPAPRTTGSEPRIRTVEDLQRRLDERRSHRHQARRSKRAAVVFAMAALLGVVIGWTSGWLSWTTPAEMAADEMEATRERDAIDEQVDRVLSELWRMEGAERVPSVGRR